MDFETVVQSGLEIRDRTAYKSVRSDRSAVPQSGPASLLQMEQNERSIAASLEISDDENMEEDDERLFLPPHRYGKASPHRVRRTGR